LSDVAGEPVGLSRATPMTSQPAPNPRSHGIQPFYHGATGVSTCFGTFGELLQGVLPGRDGDFLVTLPIARWSRVIFQMDPSTSTVQVWPHHKHKSLRLAQLILEAVGAPAGGVLTIDSSLPEGKGMASSSADLVATARAVGNALRLDLSPRLIEQLLCRIEPTDGVLYPGIVAFDHRRVRLRARLGALPAMTILGLDEGGIVDTVEFNRITKPFSAADQREYAQLLDRMSAAVAHRDLAAVGEIATQSSLMNQALAPKRLLPAVLAVCADVGALGVVAAHSGTMLGMLFDVDAPTYREQISGALQACARISGDVSLYRSLSFE
jgi:L-threonine kinase